MSSWNRSSSLVVAVLATISCSARPTHLAPAAEPPAASSVAADPGRASKEAEQSRPPGPERKIIRTGEIILEVESIGRARQAILDQVRAAGGYLSSAQASHAPDEAGAATLVVRVPASRLEDAVRALGGVGQVVRESLGSEEITEAYYDVEARLGNARRLEARLLDLVTQRASKVSELLEVERELGRVREEIERLEGRRRLWDAQVALATLTVHLLAQQPELASRGLGARLRQVLRGSWQALTELGRGLLLAGAALAPWLPLGVLLAWLIWRVRRARRLSA
jgi:hypothetical protein